MLKKDFWYDLPKELIVRVKRLIWSLISGVIG